MNETPERPACCAPGRGRGTDTDRGTGGGGGTGPAAGTAAPHPDPDSGGDDDAAGPMVALPGGSFLMGSDEGTGFPGDGEGPAREVRLAPFSIAAHAVTNRRFAAFAEATGHVTDAERFGWSYVFAGFLPAVLRREATRVPGTPWWCGVAGATWRHPEGPGSDVGD
uniref:SUMF1/EgtB/PvdO family nonheme iron enzyme n=1 Tax=Streptomyces sp. SBT349 TaxID=1580539 RepID=UPI000AB9B392